MVFLDSGEGFFRHKLFLWDLEWLMPEEFQSKGIQVVNDSLLPTSRPGRDVICRNIYSRKSSPVRTEYWDTWAKARFR